MAMVSSGTAQDDVFPFVVAYDAPANVTDLSGWLPRPAGDQGRVRVADGHFVNDAGPVRFWGTNLCFDACFPAHEQAERLAARLARLGINVVRMHHMDARSIWGNSPNKLTIDPRQLERLDYLVAQLKQHGVYTNLNLHVSRTLGAAEGFVGDPALRPKYDKGLDNFEPRMIELQKRFARDLLLHRNPYTNSTYAAEPAIAFVEINNENALFTEWYRGNLDTLPDPYAGTFRRLWNNWLRDKYTTRERLAAAWNEGARPTGDELLADVGFSMPPDRHWSLERDNLSDAEWSIASDGPDGARCLRLVVHRRGSEAWRPQFSQRGLQLRKGEPYTLTFAARAVPTRPIGVNVMMAHAPYERLGLSSSAAASERWQTFRFTFTATADDGDARVTFTGLPPGEYELANVSLRPGGIDGLGPDERFEDHSIAVMARGRQDRTPPARRDFIAFLWDTEQRYWSEMNRFLKEELGVQALVSGTQLSYSPVRLQAEFDYIDAHAYWQHPRFPGRPWDPNDWYVNNLALVNAPGGTLTSLAGRRVRGMPYTVSEYNHPQPIAYAAEAFPMLAAMGAHQAWDGLYSFSYAHNDDFEPDHLASYFDIQADAARLVHMPACVAIFVRGDLPSARREIAVPLSRQAERETLFASGGDPWSLNAEQLGVDPLRALAHRVVLQLDGRADDGERRAEAAAPATQPFVADTGMMRWEVEEPERGRFVVDTPRTKLLTGFVDGETISLHEVTLRVGKTRLGWCTISLTCLDGQDLTRGGRVLLAASGWQRNTDARLEELGGDRITLRRNWGSGPLLCEGIAADVDLAVPPSRLECYALDEAGNRAQQLAVAPTGSGSRIQIDPRFRTLWYEIVIGER